MISKTRLGESFPIGQFQIKGFSTPYRKDRDKNGGSIILYVREDIPFKQVSLENGNTNIEHCFIESNLRKKNSYNPDSNLTDTHLNYSKKGFDHCSVKFHNWILIGDFNSENSNKYLKAFCESYNLKSLIKNRTCFKKHDILTTMYWPCSHKPTTELPIILYNSRRFDFHRFTVTVSKAYFKKQEPNIIMHRGCKKFLNQIFREEFVKKLSEKMSRKIILIFSKLLH